MPNCLVESGFFLRSDFARAFQIINLLRVTVAREPGDRDRRRQVLLGHPLCQNAFRLLAGCGASRMKRLLRCARRNLPAPLDGRMLPKVKAHADQSKVQRRAAVVAFLEKLYVTLSEPMPEAQGPVHGDRRMAFQRRRGRRPKLASKLYRNEATPEMRLLPPATFSDYHRMFRANHALNVSLKLFNRVAWLNLAPRSPSGS